jgi:hypothetical protein
LYGASLLLAFEFLKSLAVGLVQLRVDTINRLTLEQQVPLKSASRERFKIPDSRFIILAMDSDGPLAHEGCPALPVISALEATTPQMQAWADASTFLRRHVCGSCIRPPGKNATEMGPRNCQFTAKQ